MITAGTPDSLKLMIPPDRTALLAGMASRAGLSTVDMASKLLSDALDDVMLSDGNESQEAAPPSRKASRKGGCV
jgi:hypothetical protein